MVLGAAVVGVLGAQASAANLSWDAGITGGAAGGSGTWQDGGATRWYDGASNVAWNNAASPSDTAIFGGTAGNVTVSGGVTASAVRIDTTGYVISSGTINLIDTDGASSGSDGASTGNASPSFNVATGATATISSNFTTNGDFIVGGTSSSYAGTLVLAGQGTYAGGTRLVRGTTKLGVDNAFAIGSTLTQSANPGTLLDLNGFNQRFHTINGASQSAITNTSSTFSTLTVGDGTNGDIANSSQQFSGNLNIVKDFTGDWIPAVTHTYTGTLTIKGGFVQTSNNTQLGAVGQASVILSGTGSAAANLGQIVFNVEQNSITSVFDRNIEIVGVNNRFNSSGVKTAILSGVISGNGDFRLAAQTNQGGLVLGGNNTYTGVTVLNATGLSLVAAHDNAFGASPSVSTGTGTAGLQKSLLDQNINIGATTNFNLGAVLNVGLGSLHNFNGDNSIAGSVTLASANAIIAAESGSSLHLKGVVSGGQALNKGYGGTVILSAANTYTGNTAVNQGTLRVDFSQAGAPANNIINSVTNSSSLALNGGVLEVIGKSGSAVSQRFASATINPGFSQIIASNATDGVAITIAGTTTRNSGSTLNFVLPTGSSVQTTSGGTNTILANTAGVAYATVGRDHWAAKATDGLSIVSLNSLVGAAGYTATTASSLSGNANVAAGTDTTVGATTISSLRFGVNEARTITLTGDLVTGGILNASTVGSNVSTITGSNITGPSGGNNDLVVLQNNLGAKMTIASNVVNNGANTTSLVKGGQGTLELTGTNTYGGATVITEGVLLANGGALPSGNIELRGGVLGLTSSFTRTIGTGANQFRWFGTGGGFASYNGVVTVNTGAWAWNSTSHLTVGGTLILGSNDATGTIDILNNIDLDGSGVNTTQAREIRVQNGSANIDADISGVISGGPGINKTGAGTLELSGANTADGAVTVQEGRVILTGSFDGVSSGAAAGFYVNNGSNLTIGANGANAHHFAVSDGLIDFSGAFSYTTRSLTMGGGAVGTTSTFATGSGTMTMGLGSSATTGGDGMLIYNGHIHNDNGASITGNLALGTSARIFQIANSTAAADDVSITALVSGVGGGITKTGAGTLFLNNASNSFTGALIVNEGTVRIGAQGTLVTGKTIAVNAGTLNLNNTNLTTSATTTAMGGGAAGTTALLQTGSGILTLGGNVTYNGQLSNAGTSTISGNLDLGGATRTFTVNDSTSAASDMIVSANITNGGLTKAGAGTLKLTGTNNYGTTTAVSAGTLLINGSNTSAVTVANGATLGGTGAISGSTSLSSGGRINAGENGAGTLTVATLTLVTGSFARFDIDSLENDGNYDQINSTSGTITYAGTLEVDFSQNFGGSASWDLFDGAMTGNFTLITDISNTYQTSDLSFDSTTGVLSVSVPEPASLSLLALGAGALLCRRRRQAGAEAK